MGQRGKKSRSELSQPPDASAARAVNGDSKIIKAVQNQLIPYINERLRSQAKPRRDKQPLGILVSGYFNQCHLQDDYNPGSPLLVGFGQLRECYEKAGYEITLYALARDSTYATFHNPDDLMAYVNQVRGDPTVNVSIVAR